VVNGRRDVMVPSVNSYHLAQNIPGAQLVVYPDSGHGSLSNTRSCSSPM
jgi:pimeloyl-ACP methyl ester carboxylesterase